MHPDEGSSSPTTRRSTAAVCSTATYFPTVAIRRSRSGATLSGGGKTRGSTIADETPPGAMTVRSHGNGYVAERACSV